MNDNDPKNDEGKTENEASPREEVIEPCQDCKQKDKADPEYKDSYDEFCDRIAKVKRFLLGIFIRLKTSWTYVSFHEKLQFSTSAIGLIILIVYTGATIKMYRANKKSADAAKSAADTARDTLIASNRPWLDIDIAIAGPLTFNTLGGHLTVSITKNNVGHGPAVRVAEHQEVFQMLPGIPQPWDEIKKACSEAGAVSALPSNRGLTETVFPQRPQQQNWNLTINPQEINKQLSAEGGKYVYRPPYVYPLVIWCVAYRADFSTEEHHTGYAWEVWRKDPVVPGGIGFIDPKKVVIPSNELMIFKVPFIGPLAD